ncbi:MAG: hypothetical protein ABSB82_03755 [Terriglobia bacterium]|jgi:uncharacterized protein YwgA
MEIGDFILCVIDAWDGVARGRTLLQKRCYFVALLSHMEKQCGFQAHYYGPYSSLIDGALSRLVAVGFVDESRIGFGAADSSGFEIRRHDYTLTPDGREMVELLQYEDDPTLARVHDSISRLKEAGNPNYVELSIAAKAYFIINQRNGPVTRGEIRKEAEGFGWNIEPGALDKAIDFLERIPLVQTKKRSHPAH